MMNALIVFFVNKLNFDSKIRPILNAQSLKEVTYFRFLMGVMAPVTPIPMMDLFEEE